MALSEERTGVPGPEDDRAVEAARGGSEGGNLRDSLSYEILQLRVELGRARAALAEAERLAEEYAHRNRNLLAVAGMLIRRALAGAGDPEAARAALEALPGRLAAAHDAAARLAAERDAGGGEGDLGALLAATLAGFEVGGGGAAALDGPAARLTPPAARLLGLLAFELATNAVKHGALGRDGGTLAVRWSGETDGGLRLVWAERWPAAAAETGRGEGRAGGGTRLLEALRRELGGSVSRRLERGGARVEIVLPRRCVLGIGAWPEPAAEDGPQAGPDAGPDAGPGRALRALVVEDNPLLAVDLGDMLRARGFAEVVETVDAPGAVAALAERGFDLVLLDLGLNGERGEALVPLAGNAAVVVVSGAGPEDLPEAVRALPRLAKPYGPQDLDALLGTLGLGPPPAEAV